MQMNDIEQKCFDNIKGMFENYMELVANLSKMDLKEINELDINEPLIKILDNIKVILNRFYDIEIKKIKEKEREQGAVSGIINEEGERK